MKSSRLSILMITLAVTISLGLLLKLVAESSRSSAQDVGQSLDIARHADEPFGIVDIKVGDRSLRKNISVKYRNGDENREGLDKVDFRGKGDWCKLLHVTLRNISGRPIVTLQAYLYIKPPGSEVWFGANLEQTLQQIVEPGADIELTVNEGSWARAEERMKRRGADGRSATVMLSVENVAFSDDLMWDRGRLHQRDPQNRSKWSVIDKKNTRLDGLVRPIQFKSVAWKPDENRFKDLRPNRERNAPEPQLRTLSTRYPQVALTPPLAAFSHPKHLMLDS